MEYGFIGVGAIAAAIVTGLCKDVESAPEILLSPRNAGMAARLAGCYPTVRIGADNQAVVDGASTLILCLRPQDARAVLKDLVFADDQIIISAMAGVSVEAIKLLVAPAREVSRVIPLPPVAERNGMTPIHPPSAAAKALFGRLGETIDLHDVDAFDALSASTSTIAAHFAYLNTISRWLVSRNIPEPAARRYVASTFAGLATALGSGRDFEQLSRDHATPGGINELFLTILNEAGVFEDVSLGLQRAFDRLKTLA
ncbi:MAG TPA: NAD(P)-binding domain-containing protein [Blastocatellia bacterium]|nr:NAD(P)-binding domain-containing protein [Blastocatellia bacterium]